MAPNQSYTGAVFARGAVLFLILPFALSAETLEAVLDRARVPTASIPAVELQRKVTSYAVNARDPFLLAYYEETGAAALSFPLRLIRYSRSRHSLVRSALDTFNAPFSDLSPIGPDVCLGSALKISEEYGRVYLDTHIGPSAGCVLVFSNRLSLEATLSGAFLGVLDRDCVIVAENEIHFASVSPMRLKAIDLRRRAKAHIYPPRPDTLRDRYSDLIRAHMPPRRWCAETNSQCDPLNFDCELDSPVAVNSAAMSFGFIACFDSGGFGPDAAHYVPRECVAYLYHLENGVWQHRETPAAQIRQTWGVATVEEAISSRSHVLFRKR